MATVREEFYTVLRKLGMTTVFGNPGSTELPMLNHFPEDFRYVLGLQEATVVAMADGYAQATGKPAFVNLHTAPGVGNALGSIITAYYNKTPLVITAGQQVRATLLMEPWLVNKEATELPKPYVKWSHEPARAEDVPAAIARAYYIANQQPSGPVFVSIPMDDWDRQTETCPVRQVSWRQAPDPVALKVIADALAGSRRPALILGAAVDRSGAWDATVRFAEAIQAAVFGAPISSRAIFPEDHPLFQGFLPFAQKALGAKLAPYDVAVVIGAPLFNYYPYVPGPVVEASTQLFHITDDPDEAARAPFGTSVVGDVGLAMQSLAARIVSFDRKAPEPRQKPDAPEPKTPISPAFVMSALAEGLPGDAVIVAESPSNLAEMRKYLPIRTAGGSYTAASGGLGWAMPAAVGIALGNPSRRVVGLMGDGSSMYSIQALWTAVQHGLPVVYIVMHNAEYTILKAFAEYQQTNNNLPGLDLPGIDIVSIARGMGCEAARVDKPEELAEALRTALASGKTYVLDVIVDPTIPPLMRS